MKEPNLLLPQYFVTCLHSSVNTGNHRYSQRPRKLAPAFVHTLCPFFLSEAFGICTTGGEEAGLSYSRSRSRFVLFNVEDVQGPLYQVVRLVYIFFFFFFFLFDQLHIHKERVLPVAVYRSSSIYDKIMNIDSV